jgi:hypothetical protein
MEQQRVALRCKTGRRAVAASGPAGEGPSELPDTQPRILALWQQVGVGGALDAVPFIWLCYGAAGRFDL